MGLGAGDLKFVLFQEKAPPAKRVLDNEVDKYKEQIRRLYLEDGLTRSQTIKVLQGQGFKISPDQFSKAIARWGFTKQPRRKLQSITEVDSGEGSAFIDHQTSEATATTKGLSSSTKLNKRPRSPEELSSSSHNPCENTQSSCHVYAAKRCKPLLQREEDLVAAQTSHDGLLATERKRRSCGHAEDICIETRPSTKPLVISQRFLSRIDWLRIQYLTCCYFFETAFEIVYKASLQEKKLPRNMMAMWLHLVRTAKSKHARHSICEILESLRVGPCGLFGPPHVDGISDMDARHRLETHQELFQFHRNLARIYSYYPDKPHEVKKHLKLSRSFMSSDCIKQICDSKCLNLWTLYHLLEGRDNGSSRSRGKSTDDWLITVDPSQISHPDPWTTRHPLHSRNGTFIPGRFIDALPPGLCNTMFSYLAWCKLQLELTMCTQGRENLDKPIHVSGDVLRARIDNLCPSSVSEWKYNRNTLTLWVHSCHLFSYLWPRMDLNHLLEDIGQAGIISGDVPLTQVLMIICRMIVDESRFVSSPLHINNDDVFQQGSKPGTTIPGLNIGSCLQAISILLDQCTNFPRTARARFAHHFCDHHSGPSPMKGKSELIQSVQDGLLETFESRTESVVPTRKKAPKSAPKSPVSPSVNIDWVVEFPEEVTDKKPPNTEKPRRLIKTSHYEETQRFSMNSLLGTVSSIASGSTSSLMANERFLSALERTSTFSQSTFSLLSDSSSLRRFMAARDTMSKARTELKQSRERLGSESGLANGSFGDEGAGIPAKQHPAHDESGNNTQGTRNRHSLSRKFESLRKVWGGKE